MESMLSYNDSEDVLIRTSFAHGPDTERLTEFLRQVAEASADFTDDEDWRTYQAVRRLRATFLGWAAQLCGFPHALAAEKARDARFAELVAYVNNRLAAT